MSHVPPTQKRDPATGVEKRWSSRLATLEPWMQVLGSSPLFRSRLFAVEEEGRSRRVRFIASRGLSPHKTGETFCEMVGDLLRRCLTHQIGGTFFEAFLYVVRVVPPPPKRDEHAEADCDVVRVPLLIRQDDIRPVLASRSTSCHPQARPCVEC